MYLYLRIVIGLILFASHIYGACHQPSPAFPLPEYRKYQTPILDALQRIQSEIEAVVAHTPYDTTSFSIEVTSSKQTLWSSFHTARDRDPSRPGTSQVNGFSVYRIASITKTFTVLGLLHQHASGNLDLDNSVDTYLPELKGPQNGSIPWKDITLRSLASQLSGLPREWPSGGSSRLPDPTKLGLPPPNNTESLPDCDVYGEEKRCTEADLVSTVKSFKPFFAPNAKSTYSNIAFEILGLVLSKVAGTSFDEAITSSILKPIGMTATTFIAPADSFAVLPKNQSWYFSVDQGIHKPTGGLYSTSSDLSLYLRYILTHYNGLHTGFNWLQPVSYSDGLYSFYGMPWEIYRAPLGSSFRSRRAVSFFNKSGGQPGYTSIIMISPDYDLGITVLVGGNAALLSKLLDIVTVPLIEAAEQVAGLELENKYAGVYTASDLNSTLKLAYAPEKGLYVQRWISNGTDILALRRQLFPSFETEQGQETTRLQIVPTMLYVDEEKQSGELWRALPVPMEPEEEKKRFWDDYCVTEMSGVMYDGRYLNEFVFWEDEVELTAFRIRLRRVGGVDEQEGREKVENLVVQRF